MSLEPIVFQDSIVLVLGSFPGEISLKEARYYADQTNYFWRILSEYTGLENPNYSDGTIEDKRKLSEEILEKVRFAVWDMYESCERKKDGKASSSDKSITNEKWNDIERFLSEHNSIKWVAIAGKKNYKAFKKRYPNLDVFVLQLPSTSNSSSLCGDDKSKPVWTEWQALIKSINE